MDGIFISKNPEWQTKVTEDRYSLASVYSYCIPVAYEVRIASECEQFRGELCENMSSASTQAMSCKITIQLPTHNPAHKQRKKIFSSNYKQTPSFRFDFHEADMLKRCHLPLENSYSRNAQSQMQKYPSLLTQLCSCMIVGKLKWNEETEMTTQRRRRTQVWKME